MKAKNTNKAEVAPAPSGQHTPGPWKFDHIPEFAEYVDLIQDLKSLSKPPFLVGVVKLYDENARREANARLIAAAPELLEALKVAYARMELAMANDHSSGSNSGIRYSDCELVRKAIAKAEGKE